MTYSLNNKLTEANAVYKICEAVRMILNNELHAGKPKEEIINKLIGFYRSMSPRMAEALEGVEPLWQFTHLTDILANGILIHLSVDEMVDFVKVKAFLKETWPDNGVVNFNSPENVSYISMGGQKYGINPTIVAVGKTATAMLEKADLGRAHPDHPIFIDMSKPIEATYGQEPDVLLKTERGAPISFATIQEVDAEMAKMPEDIKHALYRYWSALNVRDVPMQLEWTHFGTFACWAVKNGYELGHRLKKAEDELGYVIGNVTWVPVEEMRE